MMGVVEIFREPKKIEVPGGVAEEFGEGDALDFAMAEEFGEGDGVGQIVGASGYTRLADVPVPLTPALSPRRGRTVGRFRSNRTAILWGRVKAPPTDRPDQSERAG